MCIIEKAKSHPSSLTRPIFYATFPILLPTFYKTWYVTYISFNSYPHNRQRYQKKIFSGADQVHGIPWQPR